jgi:hypothetical protein
VVSGNQLSNMLINLFVMLVNKVISHAYFFQHNKQIIRTAMIIIINNNERNFNDNNMYK